MGVAGCIAAMGPNLKTCLSLLLPCVVCLAFLFIVSYGGLWNRVENPSSPSDGSLAKAARQLSLRWEGQGGTEHPSVSSKRNSFCSELVRDTYSEPVQVCAGANEAVRCFVNPTVKMMGMCIVHDVIVNPKMLRETVRGCDVCSFEEGFDGAWLTADALCSNASSQRLSSMLEQNDYARHFINKIAETERIPPSKCDMKLNRTVYMFMGHSYHIYFQLLAFYNLHKALIDMGAKPGEHAVIRISSSDDYATKMGSFETALFPGILTLDDFEDQELVCFSEVVLVPWTFASPPFRCRMDHTILSRCWDCDGRNDYGASFASFRTRVLTACNLSDLPLDRWVKNTTKKVVVVLRKPYIRSLKPLRQFRRILTNKTQEHLLSALRHSFPSTDIMPLYLEDLPMCEQIRHIHEADVVMGVHGAGLSHMWWLQRHALVFEMVPEAQLMIRGMKLLAVMTGVKHIGYALPSESPEDPFFVLLSNDVVSDIITVLKAAASLN